VPTYQYVCTECGTPLEAVQAFSDPALTECPTCGGRLRKVFSAVGVVFKGSGFYRTDSRSDNGKQPATVNGSGKKNGDGAAGSSSGAGSVGKATSESSTKPAAPSANGKPATKTPSSGSGAASRAAS
jgi:putative FmdB family regulatory protein